MVSKSHTMYEPHFIWKYDSAKKRKLIIGARDDEYYFGKLPIYDKYFDTHVWHCLSSRRHLSLAMAKSSDPNDQNKERMCKYHARADVQIDSGEGEQPMEGFYSEILKQRSRRPLLMMTMSSYDIIIFLCSIFRLVRSFLFI